MILNNEIKKINDQNWRFRLQSKINLSKNVLQKPISVRKQHYKALRSALDSYVVSEIRLNFFFSTFDPDWNQAYTFLHCRDMSELELIASATRMCRKALY